MWIRAAIWSVIVGVLISASLVYSAAAGQAPAILTTGVTTAPDLTGTWLIDQSPTLPNRIMNTTIRVQKNRFTIHGFWDLHSNWTGMLDFADDGVSSHVAVCSDGLDLKEKGSTYGYPKCRLPGIYTLIGDRLTISFAASRTDPRPSDFQADDHVLVASFVRVPTGWAGLPKMVKVTVLDPDGHPDPGARLYGYMSHMPPIYPKDGKYFIDTTKPAMLTTSAGMEVAEPDTVGSDGSINLPYSRFDDQELPSGAIDPVHKWVGFVRATPATLRDGTLTIRMSKQRTVRGMISVDGEQKPGEHPPWRGAYLSAFNDRFAFCDAGDGHYEFCVAAGTYSLYTYGNDLVSRTQTIEVPPGEGDFMIPPVVLLSSKILSLIGKPAPELADVEAWKNGPVKISDLKGKVVLIDFWGYWCGNCVHDMPEVFRLYDKYKDKGLVIVSVHVDDGGEVDTVEKLDAKTKMYRDGYWKGRDLPFPVALCSGLGRGSGNGSPDRYGIQYYPTAVLIDRAGKVLGFSRDQLYFDLSDRVAADAAIEKLLDAK